MKISVVTVAYNSAATIADTLRSVAAQDWPDYEHIIVDGGSKDDTMAIVARHAHPRLSAVSESDKGPYDAMNKGLARATGDAIGFLNSDDFFCRPDALRLIAGAFEGGADCVAGATTVVHRTHPLRVQRHYGVRAYARWMLRFGHMPPHPSFYVRRSVIDRVGGFDPAFRISGDFDWMVRLLLRHRARMAIVPQTLAAFREGGLSTRDFTAKMTINREMGRSLRSNAVASNLALLWGRYPFKMTQLLGRPKDYPRYLGAMGLPTPPP